MSVPANVQRVLDKQNISYSVSMEGAHSAEGTVYQQRLRRSGVAKSVILGDMDGRVQVIIPADCLLDINTVNQLLERSLRALSEADLKGFYEKHDLEAVPALPQLAGMLTLVDERLMAQESVLLDSGAGDILQVSQQGFAVLAGDAVVCEVGIPLADLEKKFRRVQNDERDIFDAVKNFTTLRIKQRLEETLELPPLAETAHKIIKLRANPAADIGDLADIVELDPSLAAQVVSWAASPYYSAPGKIKSIHDAIVRVLGFDMVLNLALGLSLGKTLSVPKSLPRGATPYWHQAVYTAACVEALVTAIPREHRPGFGLSYLAGLLHNFGWLVLAEVFPPYFKSICRLIEANSHVPPQFAELHVLGVTRDQIAGWLLNHWNMPIEVVTAVRYQSLEDIELPEYGEYAKVLQVAQRLLQQRGIGQGPKLEISDHILDDLQLDLDKAQQSLDAIFESSDELVNIAKQMSG